MRVEPSLFLAPAVFGLLLMLAGCSATGQMGQPSGGHASTSAGPDIAVGQSVGDNIRVVASLPAPVDATGMAIQRIAPNDVLQIDVFGVDTLDQSAEVDGTGQVTLQLVGRVPAAGKTTVEFQEDLKRAYGRRYLQNPEITVAMKSSAGQRVTMDGEFRSAGLYPTGASTSLIQAIALAGGFTNIADPAKVFVFRTVGNERLVAQFNADRIREGKAPDPRIAGGDIIVAFPSGIRVLGQNLREALGVASSVTGVIR